LAHEFQILETLKEMVCRNKHREEHVDREFLRVLKEILHELSVLTSELKPKRITQSISNRFSGETPMADNVLVFNVGQTSTDTITPLLKDGVTPSGGTVSNLSVSFSDPSATATVSGANAVLFTGVAPSTGPVSGSVSATVTDTDGAVSTWTQAFTVQTNAVVPPEQLTQSIANVFSTPA